MKLSNILSETITYTPEKIDEFVDVATKDLENAKQVITKGLDRIYEFNIKDLGNSVNELKSLLEKINTIKKGVYSKYEKYYDIVGMYEVGELPNNVSKLEDIVVSLDDAHENINYLVYVIEYLISAGEDLSRINKNK